MLGRGCSWTGTGVQEPCLVPDSTLSLSAGEAGVEALTPLQVRSSVVF